MNKNNNIINRLAELVERQNKLQEDVVRAKFALRDRMDKELTDAYTKANKALVEAVKPQVSRLNQIFMELNPDAEHELSNKLNIIDDRIQMYAEIVTSPRFKRQFWRKKNKKAVALSYKIKNLKEDHYAESNRVYTDLFPDELHPRYEEAKSLAIHISAEHKRYHNDPSITKLTDLIAKLK